MKDNNPNAKRPKYWFKRRRYGYGWTPVTKEGWGIVVVFLGILILGALAIKDTPKGEFTKEVGFYLIAVAIVTVILVRVSMNKGPKPKWRWGVTPKDNSTEDF